jgi:hypothetical protein
MRRTLRNAAIAAVAPITAIALGAALSACDSGASTLQGVKQHGYGTPVTSPAAAAGDPAAAVAPGPGGVSPGTGAATGSNGSDPTAAQNPNLDQRQVNYGEALRTASLKLVGELPTLAQIDQLAAITDPAQQKIAYENQINAMLGDPRFAAKMITFFRNTFKTGDQGQQQQGQPSFDTAATFAAMVVVQDRPYTDLFTAASGTCPTYANGTFTPADCQNNAPTAGVLTDPGLMAQFYANMSFRRVRFIQETFVCSAFPAEYASNTRPMGVGTYTSPWDFDSITGGASAKINFKDTSAIICANCHTSLNHIAPLFGHFDMNGQYDAANFHVLVPVPGNPTATLSDWLPAGQQFAWRNGKTVTDIPSLGQAIAADPDVARCAVNRIWNFAMSRGDIVNDLATVPPVVTDPYVQSFSSGFKMKQLIHDVFTSDDFVKF